MYLFLITRIFYIRRGTNECGIESGVTAGIPALWREAKSTLKCSLVCWQSSLFCDDDKYNT